MTLIKKAADALRAILPQRLTPRSPFEVHWQVYHSDRPSNAGIGSHHYDLSGMPNIIVGKSRNIGAWVGVWPEIKEDGTVINGGIPALADFNLTRQDFVAKANAWCPDANFDGWLIIDHENWWPQWDRVPQVYRDAMSRWLDNIPPNGAWDPETKERVMRSRWEKYATKYLLDVIALVRELRPKAKIAYYGLMIREYYKRYGTPAGEAYQALNERVLAIHEASDAVVANIYQFYPSNTQDFEVANREYVRTNILEAKRIARLAGNKPVYLHVWYRYHPGGNAPYNFCLLQDLELQLKYPKELGVKGVFLWGDENTQSNALMRVYINDVMGPVVRAVR